MKVCEMKGKKVERRLNEDILIDKLRKLDMFGTQ